MAANLAGKPVFNAQNPSNSYTNINGALVTLQAESQVVAQKLGLLATAPPTALVQIHQQLHNILQQLQGINANVAGIRAESYNHKARIQNTRVCKVADPLAPLHNVNTNNPIANFPMTLQQLSNLFKRSSSPQIHFFTLKIAIAQLRTILGELGVPFPAAANGAPLKALLRTDIGCAEI